MPDRPFSTAARRGLATVLGVVAAGCASPELPAPPPPVVASIPAPAPAPEPAPAPGAREPSAPAPVVQALVHADRVRGMPQPDLGNEVARLASTPATPLVQVQLALTLMQTRSAVDNLRASQLLQRVLSQDAADARALHPLCRQLLAQLAEQKRLEDLNERQSQQLREAQRRADQLADRLDALRAIERARPRMP
ncbi:hypothetical protein ACPWT1_02290 [Ramlibacter sp. MMS24-I3-19]|uniref:hypothetical protein n=1 Tax=Ramlibacter sp. MMS24-I3-19 TaxID=3416606 RepID=UPI003D04BE02